MSFETTLLVGKDEAAFLVQQLQAAMPLSATDTIACGVNTIQDQTEICIRTVKPLTLEQRRFLIAHGLTFTVRSYVRKQEQTTGQRNAPGVPAIASPAQPFQQRARPVLSSSVPAAAPEIIELPSRKNISSR